MKNKFFFISLVLTASLSVCGCEVNSGNGKESSGLINGDTQEEVLNLNNNETTGEEIPEEEELPMTVERYYNQPDAKASKDAEVATFAENADSIVRVEWTAEGDVLSYIYITNRDLTEEEVRSTFEGNMESAKNLIGAIKNEAGVENAAFRHVMKKEDGTVYSDVTFYEDGTFSGTLGGIHVDEEIPMPETVESYYGNPEHAAAKTAELEEIASYTGAVTRIDWKVEGDTFTFIYYFDTVLSQTELDSAAKTEEDNKLGRIDMIKNESGASEVNVGVIYIDASGEEVLNLLLTP